MTNRGSVLLICYFVVCVLFLLGAAFLARVVSEANMAIRYNGSTRAFWLAEAGIQHGLLSVNSGDWSGWDETNSTTQTINIGDYHVAVDASNSTITSRGWFPGEESANRFERTVQVTISRSASEFTYAAFGDAYFNMTGNALIDSYDSSNPGYRGTDGDAGTNGAIWFGNETANPYVYGNLTYGAEGGYPADWGNHTSSDETPEQIIVPMVPVTVPGYFIGSTNLGTLTVKNKKPVTIRDGTYMLSGLDISNGILTLTGNVKLYISGGLNITGLEGKMEILGTVTIYCSGDMFIEGQGILNASALPSNCVIYGTGPEGTSVRIGGEGAMYAGIYAPNSDVMVHGNGEIFGSVMGKTFTSVGNGKIHYDEALKNTGGASGYIITSWQEL